MIGFQVRGAERVAANLARAAADAKQLPAQQLMRAGLLVQRELRARVSAPGFSDQFWGRQGGVGATMTGRSGKTRQRIVVGPVLQMPLPGGGSVGTIHVGSPDPHMALQETGGVIQGQQYLRIPTAAAQTAAGVDVNAGRSVRGLAGYFVIRTRTGNLWIVRDRGGRVVDFMYLLKRSVRIRARRIFAVTRFHTEPLISRMFGGAVTQVVRVANG